MRSATAPVRDGRGRRADRRHQPGLPRADGGVRPLPRPQVRPDPAEGLLRPFRDLPKHPNVLRHHPRRPEQPPQSADRPAQRRRRDDRPGTAVGGAPGLVGEGHSGPERADKQGVGSQCVPPDPVPADAERHAAKPTRPLRVRRRTEAAGDGSARGAVPVGQPALRPRRAGPGGRPGFARLPAGADDEAAGHRPGERPARAGRLDRVEGQPADGPRHGQPSLAAPDGPRPGADPGQLRRLRPAAEQPGPARLSRRLLRRRRLVGEEAHPHHRPEPGLSALLAVRREGLRGRPRRRAGLADAEAAAGGGGAARHDAGAQRPARPDAAQGESDRAGRRGEHRFSPPFHGRPVHDRHAPHRLSADRARSGSRRADAVRLPRPEPADRRAADDDDPGPVALPDEQPVRHPPGRGPGGEAAGRRGRGRRRGPADAGVFALLLAAAVGKRDEEGPRIPRRVRQEAVAPGDVDGAVLQALF